MTTEPHSSDTTRRGFHLSDRMHTALVVACGAAMIVGLSVAAMSMLTSPEGWVMQAANQAISDQQQAIATSYIINVDE
jgi:hypothetical protein